MKNNFFRIFLLLFAVILVALSGTTYAYMIRQTQVTDNQFTPANVACVVQETFDGTTKTSITVKNTGNIDAYLRLRFVSYWVDASGNIVGKASVMPDISMNTGWVLGSDGIYYYQSSVAPGEFTGELLSSPIELSKSDEGYYQVLEVFAEAIQSEPTRSVINSWSVTLDASGKITKVP